MTERDADGTFAAGTSGNPGGRPALSDEEKAQRIAIKELAQQHTAELFQVVLGIARNEKEKGGIRFKAASYLLNQAWGSPAAAPPSTPQGEPQTVGFYLMTAEEAAEARRKAAEADGVVEED